MEVHDKVHGGGIVSLPTIMDSDTLRNVEPDRNQAPVLIRHETIGEKKERLIFLLTVNTQMSRPDIAKYVSVSKVTVYNYQVKHDIY